MLVLITSLGCKRMRLLGGGHSPDSGHSVTFFAPPEVHCEILRMSGKFEAQQISSKDVLLWSMTNTCNQLERAQGLRFLQGLRFMKSKWHCDQMMNPLENSLVDIESPPIDPEDAIRCFKELQQDDRTSLEELYGVAHRQTSDLTTLPNWNSDNDILKKPREDDAQLRREGHVYEDLDGEQERQVLQEVDEEVQVQAPVEYKLRTSYTSSGLLEFIKKGAVSEGPGILSASKALSHTSVVHLMPSTGQGFERLYVTRDYLFTVELDGKAPLDDFLPAVHSILINGRSMQDALIISQFEFHKNQDLIWRSSLVKLCMYEAKKTTSMVSFSKLDFYSPTQQPNLIQAQPSTCRNVDLFAGTLFFDDFRSYAAMSHHLGIITVEHWESLDRTKRSYISPGDFVPLGLRPFLNWPCDCPFTEDPLLYVARIVALRNKKQDVSSTHMGMLIEGRRIKQEMIEGKADTHRASSILPKRRYALETFRADQNAEDALPRKQIHLSAPADMITSANASERVDTGNGDWLFVSETGTCPQDQSHRGNLNTTQTDDAAQERNSRDREELANAGVRENADAEMKDAGN